MTEGFKPEEDPKNRPIMEDQMEKNMENEMEAGGI